MAKTWADFYRRVCGRRDILEGNIFVHGDFIVALAKCIKPGDKVLEIGSGTGVLTAPLVAGGAKVTSVDNDTEILEMAKKNAKLLEVEIEFIEADAFKLPFKPREFVLAFSHGLLEHFSDHDIVRLLVEHQRVSDVVVVGMPLAGNKAQAFGNERYLTMEQWEKMMKEMGAVRGFTYGEEPMGVFTFYRQE